MAECGPCGEKSILQPQRYEVKNQAPTNEHVLSATEAGKPARLMCKNLLTALKCFGRAKELLKWKIIVKGPLLLIQDVLNDIGVFYLMLCHYSHLLENIKRSVHLTTGMPRSIFLIISYDHPPGILQPWDFLKNNAIGLRRGCA